jgi:DNA-binding response OmpR family regulator
LPGERPDRHRFDRYRADTEAARFDYARRWKLYVSRLRRKLGDADAIETVRGFGYRYRPPERD